MLRMLGVSQQQLGHFGDADRTAKNAGCDTMQTNAAWVSAVVAQPDLAFLPNQSSMVAWFSCRGQHRAISALASSSEVN